MERLSKDFKNKKVIRGNFQFWYAKGVNIEPSMIQPCVIETSIKGWKKFIPQIFLSRLMILIIMCAKKYLKKKLEKMYWRLHV